MSRLVKFLSLSTKQAIWKPLYSTKNRSWSWKIGKLPYIGLLMIKQTQMKVDLKYFYVVNGIKPKIVLQHHNYCKVKLNYAQPYMRMEGGCKTDTITNVNWAMFIHDFTFRLLNQVYPSSSSMFV